MSISPSSGRIKAVQTHEETPPNSESYVREVQNSPEETEKAKEIERLTRLAESNQELTKEEVKGVLKRVPLIVLADDDKLLRNALFRLIRNAREDMRSAIKLEGEDMAQCFDSIHQIEAGQLPVILCHNGEQAEEAAQILCKCQDQEGILIFDHLMEHPFGLDIFKNLGRQMPSKVTRILHSGTHHKDAGECIKEGGLDISLNKGDVATFLSSIAQAHLRKIFGVSPEDSPK